jgi:hypothetical protein
MTKIFVSWSPLSMSVLGSSKDDVGQQGAQFAFRHQNWRRRRRRSAGWGFLDDVTGSRKFVRDIAIRRRRSCQQTFSVMMMRSAVASALTFQVLGDENWFYFMDEELDSLPQKFINNRSIASTLIGQVIANDGGLQLRGRVSAVCRSRNRCRRHDSSIRHLVALRRRHSQRRSADYRHGSYSSPLAVVAMVIVFNFRLLIGTRRQGRV